MNKEGNTETPTAQTRQCSRSWKTWDVFVFVVLVVSVILFPLGGFDYLCGRLNLVVYWLLRWLSYPTIGCSAALCLRTKAFNSFISRGRNARAVAIFLLGLLASLWIVPGLRGPSYMGYMQGFGDRIRSNADIEDIRAWLGTLPEEDYSDYYLLALQSGFPESLHVFRPKVAGIIVSENGSPAVRMMWGSSLSAVWGAVIAMEDTKIPKSDFSEGGEYILAVEPGVYVWRELPGR